MASNRATLKEVVDFLVHDRGEHFLFLADFIGEEYLSTTRVIDVSRDGQSLDVFEQVFDVRQLGSKVQQSCVFTFIREFCEWSKRGYKRPRIEEPHNRFAEIGAPSTFGKNSTGGWAEKQNVPSLEIMCCRPAKSAWINLSIMHPAFAEMIKALGNESIPESADFHLARLLTCTMPSSYVVEGSRRDTINRILNENLFMTLNPPAAIGVSMIDNAFDTDGSIPHYGFSVEYKNEKGVGHSDPYMQNIGFYVKYWSTKSGPARHCCPWILMEVLGQEIGLSIAAWAGGRPTCQPITTNVPFLPVPGDQRLFLVQARLCKALRVGMATLVRWYRDVADAIPPSPQANLPFPRCAKFQGLSNEIDFEYTSVFGNGEIHRKMLFIGKRSDTNDEVLIKFTPMPYGKEVHEVMAAHGLAPILHDVRYETGLCMVVMEFVRGSRPISVDETNRTRIRAELDKIESILASHKFVHGDLRAPNVHMRREPEGLIVYDFDWAGTEGCAKYPDVLNKNETWPSGARVGAHITREHDKFMMAQLLAP